MAGGIPHHGDLVALLGQLMQVRPNAQVRGYTGQFQKPAGPSSGSLISTLMRQQATM